MDSRRDRSSDRISKTRSAIVFTLSFLKHCGEVSVVATMRAPCEGGLDQVVRTIFSIWESTRCTLSSSFPTTVKFPTRSSSPKFLENDCAQKSSKPSETKYRTAQASLSRLPEAKP
uniref:Uncharacterized protein n=1 Tax=Meleagris gallopavo TaxID=9103 RepID=A0A803YME5_MELGA